MPRGEAIANLTSCPAWSKSQGGPAEAECAMIRQRLRISMPWQLLTSSFFCLPSLPFSFLFRQIEDEANELSQVRTQQSDGHQVPYLWRPSFRL